MQSWESPDLSNVYGKSYQDLKKKVYHSKNDIFVFLFSFFYAFFVQGRWQTTQSQFIQIYSVDWTGVYETHNIEHRTEPVSH